MSGPMRSPSAFDETLLLAEAVERTVSHGDELSSLPVLVLAELPGLVKLARRVEASAQAIGPSDAFRAAARGRLMASMRETAALSAPQIRRPRRQPWCLRVAFSTWFARVAAALSAVALAGAATASASASALPGDPLYAIKQATEQVALLTAADDAAARKQVGARARRRCSYRACIMRTTALIPPEVK